MTKIFYNLQFAQMGIQVKNARPLVMDFFMVISAATRASVLKYIAIT